MKMRYARKRRLAMDTSWRYQMLLARARKALRARPDLWQAFERRCQDLLDARDFVRVDTVCRRAARAVRLCVRLELSESLLNLLGAVQARDFHG